MSRYFQVIASAAFLFLVTPALAQQWLSRVPQKPESEQTVQDYKRAFEDFYKEHPVDLKKDKLKPTFTFNGAEEEKERIEVEEYKLFSRWLWLVEPRAYPEGKLDLEKIDAIRKAIPAEDNRLILKQKKVNPLNLKMTPQNKIIWPILKFWKPLGPSDAIGGTNMGRVNSITFDPGNVKTIYIGTPDGGVWKTIDGGATWQPKFDTQPTLSVGSIVISPRNSNILYVATSDPFGYNTPFWGGTYSIGVRKSIDGGNTWTATGLSWTVSQNRTIRKLAIDPRYGKIVLAATSDGLYRTVNGGATWTQIFATSTYDVAFQPNNPNVVYATTTQVLKSTNGGASFTPTTATCAGSRYSVAVSRSNPTTVYTLCTDGTVQKSTNAGATWSTMTAPGVSLYGYYDTVLAVSPVNDKNVYVAGFNMKQTSDGGATWSSVPTAGHVDNHAITFQPGSGTTLLAGDDGGLFKSINSGATWTSLNKGLSITQFYGIGISKTTPTLMVFGAQDNGNMKLAAGTFTNITNADGMKGFIDWSNANNLYVSIQYGGLYRSTNGGASFTGISTPSSGAWTTPWTQDPVIANTIYAGTNKVYKSTDQGTTWTAISGSLAGIGQFAVLKVAPSNPKVIYAGGSTRLYRTTDAGATWNDITGTLPVATNFLTDLAIHDTDANTAYVTFSGYIAGQKVYKTTNGGAAWTNISGTLPNMPADSIVHENKPNNPLYCGTDAGVYYINDSLTDWVPYKFGLPNVIIDQLEINYSTNTIRAATYGRGAWQAPLK